MEEKQRNAVIKKYTAIYGCSPLEDGLPFIGSNNGIYLFTPSQKEFKAYVKVQKRFKQLMNFVALSLIFTIVLLISAPFAFVYISPKMLILIGIGMLFIFLAVFWCISRTNKLIKLQEMIHVGKVKILEKEKDH